MDQETNSNVNAGQDVGPEKFPLYGNKPGVTRVSRRAVMLAGVFGAAMGLVVLVFGIGGNGGSRRNGVADENAIRPTGPIESVKDLPSDYSFDVNKAQGGSYGWMGTAPATRPAGPSAEDQAIAEQIRELAEMRRKLLEQQQKEHDEALDSALIFAGAKPTTTTFESNAPATIPAFPQSPSEITDTRNHVGGGGVAGTAAQGEETPPPSGGIFQNHQQEKEAFLTQAAAVEPYLGKPLLDPISKYEVKAGSVIPGALITAINTDLPGEVIGQVTENVYDTITGHYLLIPQGARLLGKYQSLVTNGQNRALVVWQRLIYPNGQSIVLDGMPGTDQVGQAGLADQVDYHWDKLAEAVALSTSIAYAGNLAVNQQSNTNGSQDVIGDTVAQEANRIGDRIIDRELDVQPTITIRAGWPLRVLVNKDMVLAPYQP
jgi:type IV secretory pathway VirB10-like protein